MTHGPLVRVVMDFDGTLTGCAGEKLVNSSFYKMLQIDPTQSYLSPLKPSPELFAIFDKELVNQSNKRDKRRVTREAVDFLNEMIKLGPDLVELCIVTRNQEAYVRTLLKWEGIDTSNITIQSGMSDEERLHFIMERAQHSPVKAILFYDDNPSTVDYLAEWHHRFPEKTGVLKLKCFPPNSKEWEWRKEIEKIIFLSDGG